MSGNSPSSGHRGVKDFQTLLMPGISIECSAGWGRFTELLRRNRVERTVHAILIVIGSESIELPCQVVDIPEKYMVQILPSD